jgi:hypothetical protein
MQLEYVSIKQDKKNKWQPKSSFVSKCQLLAILQFFMKTSVLLITWSAKEKNSRI